MTNYSTSAISLVGLKESAIYFDTVIPANLGFELILTIGPERLFCDDPFRNIQNLWPLDLREQLLPPRLKDNAQFKRRLADVNEVSLYWTVKLMQRHYELESGIAGVTDERYTGLEKEMEHGLGSLISDFGLGSVPCDMASFAISDESSSGDAMVTIKQLELIDTNGVSWEHILEFRKCDEARERLRRFRMFAFQNYSGKSRTFIEDDIHVRLSEYRQAVKEWGFKTTHGLLTTLLNSKVMPTALGGSFISAIAGQPLTAAISALVGTTIEVAGLAMQVHQRRCDLRRLVETSPVTFIDHAKKTLSK